MPKLAFSEASGWSVPISISIPAATQMPFTAAMIGL